MVTTALGRLTSRATTRPVSQPGQGRSTMQMRKPMAKRSRKAAGDGDTFVGKRHRQHEGRVEQSEGDAARDAQSYSVHRANTVTWLEKLRSGFAPTPDRKSNSGISDGIFYGGIHVCPLRRLQLRESGATQFLRNVRGEASVSAARGKRFGRARANTGASDFRAGAESSATDDERTFTSGDWGLNPRSASGSTIFWKTSLVVAAGGVGGSFGIGRSRRRLRVALASGNPRVDCARSAEFYRRHQLSSNRNRSPRDSPVKRNRQPATNNTSASRGGRCSEHACGPDSRANDANGNTAGTSCD